MNESFTPERLTFARNRAGLTRVALAREVGVAPRSLAYWEDGTHPPSDDSIAQLSTALDLPVSFFSAEPLEEVQADAVSFRALSKMSAVRRDAALASGAFAIELVHWLEERLHLPVVDVPTYARGAADPDTAAQRLRLEWELGYARIKNAVHLVEAHGVRVFSLPERLTEDVDAFSFWWQGTPYMLLNTRKSYERLRFDVMHELGHLVMHGDYDLPRGREREQEANRFAAAFLMPEADILAAGLRNAGAEKVVAAKHRWSVSAMALTHRLHELGVTTDWTYTSTCRRLSQLGYRSGEPDNAATPREASQLLEKVFGMLRERGIRPADIAASLHVHPSTLNDLLFGLVLTATTSAGQGPATSTVSSTRPALRVLPGAN
ncbi:XRE family transcriptional regulator [Nocardioides sp. GY 10127]|uniref:helix-turn-helix domain-containing protein n=1 Tax=Nocardioides sp. GY 10127 TaxID=2569762 RepID=UPI0010A75B6F|nr:XRE family transcriptional regulator [Nocardioides sp. GY 10127]TIC86381.1 ImmA/IrrE family metallo-endopeptidase [Nocardioides sp. GY 10127]